MTGFDSGTDFRIRAVHGWFLLDSYEFLPTACKELSEEESYKQQLREIDARCS